MDGQQFDELVRHFGGGRSRRSLLKGLVGGVLGLSGGVATRQGAGADPGESNGTSLGCKRDGKNCKVDGQCCAGLICPNGGYCAAGCRIGGAVLSLQAVNPANPCQWCDPAVSTTSWTSRPAGTACDDGNACTSGDACNGAGTCAGTPLLPAISCPATIDLASASGVCGAVAQFSASATCGGVVACSHASGSTFPVGSTIVTCTATNGAGSTPCSFMVNVADAEDPFLTCPSGIGLTPNDLNPAVVNYVVTASDNCAPVAIACSPPSGSLFPQGYTEVVCTATDPNGRTDACTFPVTVECQPNCAGAICGEPNGCGGNCFGSCPAPGPCEESVSCDVGSGTCQSMLKPPGTGCGDLCHPFSFCDASGNCNHGSAISCPPISDPCSSSVGTCNPATGECEYPVSVGQRCDRPLDECRPAVCQADGSCLPGPQKQCDDECAVCNSSNGECQAIREGELCGGGSRICLGGTCASPCGVSCIDHCYISLGSDDEPDGYFCCPAEARLPGGGCCWRRNAPGVVIEGQCYDPAFVCETGPCSTECCDRDSDSGWTGVCCAAGTYCIVDDRTCKVTGSTSCSGNGDCFAAGWGAGAICAGLILDEDGAVVTAGTCCPLTNSYFDRFEGIAPVYGCCGPGSEFFESQGGCCGFPNQSDSGACIGCDCSFKNIRPCC